MGHPDVIILMVHGGILDPKQIIEVRGTVKELGKKHTVILSSHILTEISWRSAIMCLSCQRGKLVASDSTEISAGDVVWSTGNRASVVKRKSSAWRNS